jgi:D-alanyl-D-alanine carboxypeptidase (penicillin-binding protein 5/6)
MALLRWIAAGAFALGVGVTAHARTSPAPLPAASAQPAVTAPAYVLHDVASGQTIAAENAAGRREPASLTKLMTAYLTFAALRDKSITLAQIVPVSPAAWRAEGSRMFIEPRKAVTVDELMRGMIVQSGNDASIALAELVAGSESAFTERMNAEAARLGLADTHFVNATGLSNPQQYSTANDLARLAAAVIRDFPDYYPLYSLREYRYNNIAQPNRNRLLWIDPYVDGMKTGHTDAAGWCLVASAKRGDRRLLAVVLGAASDGARTSDAQRLLNYGFQAFDTVQLYSSGQPVSTLRVWKGEAKDVAAGFFTDQFLTLPKGKADKLTLSMTATEPLLAPVSKGQRLGTVKVSLDGKALAEFPLVALNEVPVANIVSRAWDTIRLWLK